MQLITCHHGKLLRLDTQALGHASQQGLTTGLTALDRLMPAGGLARGAVHEVLYQPGHPAPQFFSAVLAQAATGGTQSANPDRKVIWADPQGELYPPALAVAGFSLEQLLLLRVSQPRELVWAVGQCLACRGIGAVVAPLGRLSRIEARRLQLAAQRGGGLGVFQRCTREATEHAAVTRWLVEPAPGTRTLQRWKVQLIHGHGGLLHQPVYLECSRELEANRVRATDRLADHLPETKALPRIATG